jgi:hypothetical protein
VTVLGTLLGAGPPLVAGVHAEAGLVVPLKEETDRAGAGVPFRSVEAVVGTLHCYIAVMFVCEGNDVVY